MDKIPFRNVLIVGYGDIGRRVAKLVDKNLCTVTGLARSEQAIQQMRDENVKPLQRDLDVCDEVSPLSLKKTLVFYFAPPPSSGVVDTRMDNFLKSLDREAMPDKIVYISTSGVYGDHGGNNVTEATPVNPGADRSRRRLDAERQLQTFSQITQVELSILRVSGIYGPARLPIARLRKMTPVLHEDLAPKTNRIHEDDLAKVCIAAAIHGENAEIYNVSDGCDSNMTRYFFQIADFLGLQRPPTIGWEQAKKLLSAGMLSYLQESRQIDNSKMINQLKVVLQYPDLGAGLANIKDIS